MLVTMRGEWEEFNPWQVPMGSIVAPVLKLCDTAVMRASAPDEVPGVIAAAIDTAFTQQRAAAVLLSQQLIGRKVWAK
jgi:sulfopyruvate decarboxylase TPP-binding subunit